MRLIADESAPTKEAARFGVGRGKPARFRAGALSGCTRPTTARCRRLAPSAARPNATLSGLAAGASCGSGFSRERSTAGTGLRVGGCFIANEFAHEVGGGAGCKIAWWMKRAPSTLHTGRRRGLEWARCRRLAPSAARPNATLSGLAAGALCGSGFSREGLAAGTWLRVAGYSIANEFHTGWRKPTAALRERSETHQSISRAEARATGAVCSMRQPARAAFLRACGTVFILSGRAYSTEETALIWAASRRR